MTTFSDLGLNPMILQSLDEIGFEKPTPVQAKAIPHLINSGKDLIALAQTGTGKTAAFSLPVIHQIANQSPEQLSDAFQCIVLCPTRELAIQVAKEIQTFTKYIPGLTATPVYGGERIDKQIRALKNKPQIVVGTPGRVNDLIRRRVLKVETVKWLVLDEADEMLNMGFKEEIDEILKNMPEEKQSLLFSATMDSSVRRIASNYMHKPDEITVGTKNQGSDNVQHFYYVVHEKDRYQALRRIADVNPDIHGIVFCRTRRETQQVADKLIQDHYSAEAIHGDVSQEQRIHVMNRFRDKKVQLLVATDVAARGIDVDKLTHVINYNLPETNEAYVHRSGRTGRAHNEGTSIIIINMRQKYKIKALERKIGQSFEQAKIPSGQEICEKQLFALVNKVHDVEINESQISKYLPAIEKKFEDVSREELIKKFISVEFNRFLDHYQNATDLNSRAGKEQDRNSQKSNILFARFNLSIGKNDGINIKDFFGFFNQVQELKGVELGNIDINNDFTMFEADQNFKDKVLQSFDGAMFDDIEISITCEETGIQSSRDHSRSKGRSRGGRGGRGSRGPRGPRHGGSSNRRSHGGGGGGRRRRR